MSSWIRYSAIWKRTELSTKTIMSIKSKLYSADEFKQSKFPLHGKVIGRIEDNILILDLIGPFNQELINTLSHFRLKIFGDWKPMGNFGILINAHKSILMSPDGFNTWADDVRKAFVQYKPLALSWAVGKDVEGRSFVLPKIQSLYNALGITNIFFEEEVTARIWLTNVLKFSEGSA